MLKRLADKQRIITIILAGVLFVACLLYFVFGSSEDKLRLLVLSLVLPIVVYGFMRFAFKVVRSKASSKIMRFFVYFFFTAGTLGAVLDLIAFVSKFPNGLSPTLGACIGLVVATLAEAVIAE